MRRRRALIKTFTFRIIATIVTAVLIYAFTGDLSLAGTIGVLDFLLKLILYYGHERIWNKISWGRKA